MIPPSITRSDLGEAGHPDKNAKALLEQWPSDKQAQVGQADAGRYTECCEQAGFGHEQCEDVTRPRPHRAQDGHFSAPLVEARQDGGQHS